MRLVVTVPVHVLVVIAKVTPPRVRRRGLRRRPEVIFVREIVEAATEVPVAARKRSEPAGVGSPGI